MFNKKKKLSRRDFLKIVAVSGAAGLGAKYGLDRLNGDEIVSETRQLMGTLINIKAVGLDPKAASVAINTCFDQMSVLEGVLSRFQPQSQLSKLNRAGVLHDVHPALVELIQQSRQLSQLTDGAFDITVKPLLDLYQSSDNLPNEEQVQEALTLVGYRKLDVKVHTVSFQEPGMSITLDGIAKGFIVDEGVKALQEFGFANVMVEAGGDLMALGEKKPCSPWKIGLQAPRAEMGKLMETFNVHNQAVATSGDYMQAFTPDFTCHHIIDPRIGYSSPELASVSVLAPTVALADGLATAVMVMGKAGLALVEELSSCEAYVVTKDSRVLKSSGFQEN